MGALAHYLEELGIPTTQISLIREHTEKILPPRALWVPFALGRPLGVPNDPGFQKKVLHSALELFERQTGPVLESFEQEAPVSADAESEDADAWSCPVNLSQPAKEQTGLEEKISAFRREITELMPWYDLGRKNTGRTAVATFDPDRAADILCDYLGDKTPEIGEDDISLAAAIRISAQDLRTFYFEAVSSQPGANAPASKEFADWFWTRTAAGDIIKQVKEKCAGESDRDLKLTGKMFLVPMV